MKRTRPFVCTFTFMVTYGAFAMPLGRLSSIVDIDIEYFGGGYRMLGLVGHLEHPTDLA